MRIKAGTRIETIDREGDWGPEHATVLQTSDTAPTGFHKVRFDTDLTVLHLHESNFRIIDNRPNRVVAS